MKNNYLNKHFFGNVFIIFGLTIILYIYFPLLNLYFFPQKPPLIKTNSFFIEISKIGIISPIISNVDPFNATEYKKALEKGIAHAKNTPLPGEKGTSFLFAHSSDNPWNITRYNTVFLNLGKLQKGDLIIINRNGKKYKYKVNGKKNVWPSEVRYLTKINNNNNGIILQTCTPIGTDLMRLLVFANLDN